MNILIVDDETVSRKILLKKMELIGKCTAVDESHKALKLFDKSYQNKRPYDLITLDVSMPKMDGRQLLRLFRQKEKALKIGKDEQSKIIMVTSRMTASTIKECIKLGCNGYILKPVNKYQLLFNLGRIGLISNDKFEKESASDHSRIVAKIIKRFYAGKIQLPVFPKIVHEIKSLMDKKEPSIEQLAEIIRKDIVISSKLVSIANSPLYRGVDKVKNLNKAVIRLGVKTANGLITALVTKDLYRSDDKNLNLLLEKLWTHSFTTACIAKRLSETLGDKNTDKLFLMGIVHDIGKMMLIKAIADLNPDERFESEDVQIAVHEIHTTFGAALLKRMRFTNDFLQIAEFHHWNDFSKKEDKELRIIHLADTLANAMGFSLFNIPGHTVPQESDLETLINGLESFRQLKLDSKAVLDLTEEIKAHVEETQNAF
jgi:putative nucleotidyltransferase with HDIG domain